jgi:glycosyltransferase involved in cell wall biosynthesis
VAPDRPRAVIGGAGRPGLRVCTPHCGIDPETTSGGETFERELLVRMAARGIAFDILLARHKRHPEGVANWTIHRLPIGRGLRWPVAPLVLPPAIRRIYDTVRFDLLRVHSLRYIGPAALLARRRYRLDVPIVAHHHHLDPDPLNPFIEGRVIRAVERVVVGSEFARSQAVAELGVPAEKFSVVPYGVDGRFSPGPRPAALSGRWGLDDGPVVLFLGGLKARKNLVLLLDVWGAIARACPEARLVIVGSGPLRHRLEQRASAPGGSGRVVFTGYVPECDKVDYYRLADVLLFPSALEGFGFTVAEAMACGLPVVASNRGSLPELVVDGQGGFLADPDRPADFVTGTVRLLRDAALRAKLGAANVERAQRRFRWERCAADTAAVYEEVLDAWRRRPPAR